MQITKQLQQEIEEIQDKVLFSIHHSSNLSEQHIFADTNALRQNLRLLPVYGDEMCMFSHFFGGSDDVLPLIQTCVQRNLQYLEKWNPCHTALVLHTDFPKPIGTGIVKGTDWNTLFPHEPYPRDSAKIQNPRTSIPHCDGISSSECRRNE